MGERELQKVKNGVVADNSRRLSSNFFILFQLLLYDGNGDWREMFREADELLAVTPEQIQADWLRQEVVRRIPSSTNSRPTAAVTTEQDAAGGCDGRKDGTY